jgi:hypothetical protein
MSFSQANIGLGWDLGYTPPPPGREKKADLGLKGGVFCVFFFPKAHPSAKNAPRKSYVVPWDFEYHVIQ